MRAILPSVWRDIVYPLPSIPLAALQKRHLFCRRRPTDFCGFSKAIRGMLDGRAKMISRDGMGGKGRVAYGKEHFNLSKLAPPSLQENVIHSMVSEVHWAAHAQICMPKFAL